MEIAHLADQILVLVIGVVVIATVTALAPRVGVAGPLVLVTIGLGYSLLPITPNFTLDPEVILIGLLPPLLYAAAVSLPAMEFRRDFSTISGLSVVLVIVSSFALGLFFTAVVPGVGLALGVALGAVLSPTDAVATSIVRKLGISPRVVTVLEGESLINDATALVLLKTAAAAAVAGSFSLGGAIGSFSLAVVVAVAAGMIVGWLNLRVRAWIANTAAATALSFVVPYVAFLIAEHFEGSGLVAAVVAGIVTGQGSAKFFTAEQRLSDRVNWHTIELVLEGAVFLIMGLEVAAIINAAPEGFGAVGHAALIATGAVALILLLRTCFVAAIVLIQRQRARRVQRTRPRLEAFSERFEAYQPADHAKGAASGKHISRFRRRISRALADMAYLEDQRMGWREGTIIVWAGMRGAVTLAAAQTLPEGPTRSLLILVAFIVAVGTLLFQGSTVGPLTKLLGLAGSTENNPKADQLAALNQAMREAATTALERPELLRTDGTPFSAEIVRAVHARLSVALDENDDERTQEMRELRLVVIQAQRQRLSAARSNGRFSTAVLRQVLESLDAEELSIRAHLDKD